MFNSKIIWAALLTLGIATHVCAQPRVKIVSGLLILDDGTTAPNEKQYQTYQESLDKDLKSNSNDTSKLFYRALIYLKFNSMVAKPERSSNSPAKNLIIALQIADRADSLKMQDLKLKILRAQICRELTYRYAPVDAWRYSEAQIADRKKKYQQYKDIANSLYGLVATLDPPNSYDYQRLKIK